MDIFAQFATDPNLELDGVWVVIGGEEENGKCPRIKVARSGNKRHGRIVSKLYEAHKHTLELKNDVAEAKGEEITIDSMAQGILMGWENLSFQSGTYLPDEWSLATAKQLLSVKDFRAMVMRHADNFEKFKVHQEGEDAKN